MKHIRMKKDVLVCRLTENRAKHAEEFNEAAETYRKKLVQELKQLTVTAAALPQDELCKHHIMVSLSPPKQFVRDYDRAISMFRDTLDDEIELTQQEYT